MIPREITSHHILAASRWIDKHGIPPAREATRYGVHVGEKVYPPKFLVSVAMRIATGREHPSGKFIATEAVSYFRARDYRVDGNRKPRESKQSGRSSVNYWVIKGNPAYYNWDKDLRPGHLEGWKTQYSEDAMSRGDRIFLWESGGRSRIIGFATVARIDGMKNGHWRFQVKYLSHRFDCMPEIEELRSQPELKRATFLKPGVFRTIYPLDARQASVIYRAVASCNPTDDIWRDLSGLPGLPDIDLSFREGDKKLVSHLRAERAPGLAKKKKAAFRAKQGGKLFCECCGNDHLEYGVHREALFEVHHRKALGRAKRPVITKLKDLAVVCSNCHRVIHRHKPMISVARLSKRLRPPA